MAPLVELLRETLAPRYLVEREIGAGGMARVYLAIEEHPRRSVAIKVLEPDLSSRLLYDRFVREVEVASRLTHPHIVPIFAAGSAGGMLYYVMPYIEGESLRLRLLKQRRLPLDETLHLVLDIADALSYAHAQGVVHRDIKPENILLAGGHPVVADFGVARAISAAGGGSLTQTGHVVGSPGYMSPEQAMGGEVDARTDIYSLGCLLFELLTGELPTRPGLGESVANWEALSSGGALRGVATAEARAVKHAISKALAPLPQDRFATVAEFSEALGGSWHRSSLPRRSLLASRRSRRMVGLAVGVTVLAGVVVAFAVRRHDSALVRDRVVVAVVENRTGDTALDPLGHMAADWVTQGLTQTGLVEVVPSVSVIAATATPATGAAARLDAEGIRALGRETRAGTVVSGAYYRQGDSLRFQLSVTDARDGRVLRALDPVVGSVRNPLAAVEQVRQRVMIALGTLFDPKIAGWAGAASQPPDYRAYQEFVEGLDRFARFDYQGAREHFDLAAAGDSTFSVASIWSAAARLNLGQFAGADSVVGRLEHSRRRLAPVDRSYLAWVAAVVRGNAPGALDAARELCRVAPGSEALYLLAGAAINVNRPREALAAMAQLDPDVGLFRESYVYAFDVTTALHMLGEHRRELKEARAGLRRTPGSLGGLATELRALAALGQVDEVRQRLEEAFQSPTQDMWTPGGVALLTAEELSAHGYSDAARQVVASAIDWYERRPTEVEEAGGRDAGVGFAYFEAGRLAEARRALDSAVIPTHAPIHQDQFAALGTLGAIAAREGRRDEALRIDGVLQTIPQRYLFGRNTYQRARIHALLGDREGAVTLLQAALEQGYPDFALLHIDPALAGLRDYGPFQELLKPKG